MIKFILILAYKLNRETMVSSVPIFPIFFQFPKISHVVYKCPIIPIILLRIKNKNDPFVARCVNFVHVDVTEKGNEFPGPSNDQTSNYCRCIYQ